jgi:hypothetical protein
MGLGGSAGGVGGSNLSRGSTPDTQAALDVENVGAGAAEMIQKSEICPCSLPLSSHLLSHPPV